MATMTKPRTSQKQSSYRLNSLKGGYIGHHIGEHCGVTTGESRSLGFSSVVAMALSLVAKP